MSFYKKAGFFCLITALFVFTLTLAQGDVIAPTEETFLLPNTQKYAKRLYDQDYNTGWKSKANAPYMDILAPQALGGLYLSFTNSPGPWVAQIPEGDGWITLYQGGENGFLHEYVPLQGQHKVRISTTGKGEILQLSEVVLLDQGEVPSFIQQWKPTPQKAELMLLTAHPDDEVIFFGGLLPYYSGELQKDVVVAVMTTGSRVRKHELLNSLWACGHQTYPVMGPFYDRYFKNIDEAFDTWGKQKTYHYVTQLFRQYEPEVVVTHDKKGEYGHGAHRLSANAATYCIEKAADPTYHSKSAESYGAWQVKKLYLHLGSSENITLNWDIPLTAFDGKTGFEVAKEAFKEHVSQQKTPFFVQGRLDKHSSYDFSLVFSAVGEDVMKNDFLENIIY